MLTHPTTKMFFGRINRFQVSKDVESLDPWFQVSKDMDVRRINGSDNPTAADMLRVASIFEARREYVRARVLADHRYSVYDALQVLVKRTKDAKIGGGYVTLEEHVKAEEDVYKYAKKAHDIWTERLLQASARVAKLEKGFASSVEFQQAQLDSSIEDLASIMVLHSESSVYIQRKRDNWLEVQKLAQEHAICVQECDELEATLTLENEKDRILLRCFGVICDSLANLSIRDAVCAHYARDHDNLMCRSPLPFPDTLLFMDRLPFVVRKTIMSFCL
jgi:hypothetical protein